MANSVITHSRIPAGFDWKMPDYRPVYEARKTQLTWIREHPDALPDIKAYYREFPADFIHDWGMTYDPRNADLNLPTIIPFLLFQKQRDMIDYILDHWRNRKPGLIEKSRDAGASYVAMTLACTLCIFSESPLSIGFGSRKEEYVDKTGEPKSLFWKGRLFMDNLPVEFNGGYEGWRDAPHMRIKFPGSGSHIGGEAGDSIGRGDRTTIHFVDEAAHLDRPDLVDFSLSQTTNCRIDISSVRGMNNPFAVKRWGGKIDPFVFDWRDDPRKDDEWYAKQVSELDPVVVAQEIDRDYQASVVGVVIPAAWVRAAIDARTKLGLPLTGEKGLGLDIADEGVDKNAAVGGQGIECNICEEWSGRGSDTFATVERAFQICDENGIYQFSYDGDGMGALVRGDARIINERRQEARAQHIRPIVFRGSESPYKPEQIVAGTIGGEGKGRKNKDYFGNRKAQGWWHVRKLFQNTYRWIVQAIPCDPDDIVSISSKMPNYAKLMTELSQPTYKQNNAGKMLIEKKPDGMKSPNLADGFVVWKAPNDAPMKLSQDMVSQIRTAGIVRRLRMARRR